MIMQDSKCKGSCKDPTSQMDVSPCPVSWRPHESLLKDLSVTAILLAKRSHAAEDPDGALQVLAQAISCVRTADSMLDGS